MKTFVRQALALFLAFRLADLVNLAAGLYLVPKFVSSADLGAVLPVSTFATTVSIPAFAFALVFLREGAILARRGAWGEWKSLVKGVFVATGILLAFGGLLAAFALPRYLRAVGVSETLAGTLVIAGAFLGSVAPVYSDALNAIQRFRALGAVEVGAALARLVTLAILMPFRALSGYFAGTVIQPLARIGTSVFLLRRELAVPSRPYWTRPVARRLVLLALAVTLYLLTPLLASLAEQSVLRITLGADDSAAYYLLTRLSGILDYLTLPLLFVLFPHAAQSGDRPPATSGDRPPATLGTDPAEVGDRSHATLGTDPAEVGDRPHATLGTDPAGVRRLILGCQAATAALALTLALLAFFWGQTPQNLGTDPTGFWGQTLKIWGQTPLSLLPNGEKYADYAKYLPFLIFIGALNACQIFATNAAVAAGRFRFLIWHAPLNLAYALLLTVAPGIVSDLPALLVAMAILAALRFILGQGIIHGR